METLPGLLPALIFTTFPLYEEKRAVASFRKDIYYSLMIFASQVGVCSRSLLLVSTFWIRTRFSFLLLIYTP